MHPVEHMNLTCLVRILQMAVIKVLLNTIDDLAIVLSVHHENTGEDAVPGERVLSLQLDVSILTRSLRARHESRPILVLHLVGAAANHLHRGLELTLLAVAELPGE